MTAHEEGVSAVVGAVLILALFVSAMTVYTVTTLPEWKADREQAHQAAVRADLGGLKADIEALAARRDPGPVTASIPLEVPKVPLLQSLPARGSVSTRTDGFAASFTFSGSTRVFFADGEPAAAPSSAVPLCAGACVERFDAFVLGIDMGASGTGTIATVTFADQAGSSLTATVSHVASGGTCTGEVRLTVALPGTATVATPLLCTGAATVDLGTPSTPYRVDLLQPSHGIAARLARLQPALTVTLAAPQATLSHATAYEDTAGIVRVTGAGATQAPVGPLAGGRIAYDPSYQAYPDQRLVLEAGALFADGGGAAQATVLGPPLTLRTDAANGRAYLDWTLVAFGGEAASVSGAKDAALAVRYVGQQDVLFTTGAMTVTLTSDLAAGWYDLLGQAILLAGATQGAHADDSTPGQVTLTLDDYAWTVRLRIIDAEVDVA